MYTLNETATRVASPQHRPPGTLARQNVLFLTDTPQETEVYASVLRQRRIEAVTVPLERLGSERDLYEKYDLIVFNISAPQPTILEQVSAIAYLFRGPLLIVTCEQDERFLLQAYEAGVDDCITKPIGVSLLLAKLSVWLRRATRTTAEIRVEAPTARFTLDYARRLLRTPAGKAIKLSTLECRLVHLFLSNPGQILASSLLIRRVWIDYEHGDSILLKNLVYRLRRKIGDAPGEPHHILTFPGEGYMFRHG